jgi:hypothetical protein
MSWSERINTAASGSGRVDDMNSRKLSELKVTCKARFAGGRSSSKCGERAEMDGQPKGRECGMQSSQSNPWEWSEIDGQA